MTLRNISKAPKNKPVWAYVGQMRVKAMLRDDGHYAPLWRYVGGAYDGQMCPWPDGWEPIEGND